MSDVRLTRAAATTRRSLTPSAWLVLEELALAADHAAVASTNARALAAALGMSKDTTARALQRLIASALVERVEHRSLATGQFASIAYRVNLRAASRSTRRACGMKGRVSRRPQKAEQPPGNDRPTAPLLDPPDARTSPPPPAATSSTSSEPDP